MNDQERNELRMKVATLLGWQETFCIHGVVSGIPPNQEVTDDNFTADMPDWLNDLNACHEFERALKPIQRFVYANALETSLDLIPEGQGLGLREHRNFAYAHATAEQRCRAFVATMEKGEHHGR